MNVIGSRWIRGGLALAVLLCVATPAWALTILSWNTKHLGRKAFMEEEAALILRDADIAVFQEVGVNEKGHQALRRLGDILGKRVGDTMCMALSEVPSGGRERYAYLWRNARVAWVRSDGAVMPDCGDGKSAMTARLGVKHAARIVREPSIATFQDKASRKNFTLASIHLVPTEKRPETEVEPLFDTLKDIAGVVVVGGDFNLASSAPAFKAARDGGFTAALGGGDRTSIRRKTRELNEAYDNLWVRGATIRRAGVVNMLDYLPKVDIGTIYNKISDHCPVWAQVGP